MKATAFLPLFLLFSSCQNDNLDLPVYGDYIWGALLSSEKSENKITLNLTDPTPLSNYAAPGPSTPEYFEVYISDNMATFELIESLKVGSTALEVENLINDKPYYFYVSSHRNGFETVISDTIMTIPSTQIQAVDVPVNLSYSIEVPIFSPNNQFVAFSSPYGPNGGAFSPLYVKRLPNQEVTTIDVEAGNANWASTGNALVYIKYELDGYAAFSKSLMHYDIEKDTSITLQEIDYKNYYISSPQYLNDSEIITFSSSEGNSEIHLNDIWTINLETKEKTKISDFEKVGLVAYGYDLSANGENIYISGYKTDTEGYGTNIYVYQRATGSLTDLLVTRWRDERPTLSPNDSKIAFVSERSGFSELWIYNLTNKQFYQITGGSQFKFYSPDSNIQWLNENELIINFNSGGFSKPIKFRIE